MALENVCSPAIIYVAFSIIHILIDVFKNSYNAALAKFIIMLVFTTLLNILCERGLGIVSWFIVFIPFITMTLLSQLILMALQMSKSSENDKPKSYLDEINLMRSKSTAEPAPAVEYSECKAQKCKPGNALSDYTLDTDESVDIVKDDVTMDEEDIQTHSHNSTPGNIEEETEDENK
tara:strand:+ start:277 stop:807 length:531 start_codon:yes stop_codon:yes gene_type:complete